MRVITVSLLSIILFLSFYKGLAFQEKSMSKADIAFISNEKDTDSIQSFLDQRINIDIDQAELGYKVYLDRGLKEKNDTIQFWANFYLGQIAYSKKKYDLAIQYGSKSVQSGEKLNQGSYIISGLSILGACYQKKRDRENSLNQYLRMKKIIKQYNLKEYEIENLVSIGQIRIRLGQNEKALISLKKGLELLEKPEYKSQNNYNAKYLSAIQGIGVCFYKLTNYDEALKYYYQGLQHAEKSNLKEYIIDFNLNIGLTYIGKKNMLKRFLI